MAARNAAEPNRIALAALKRDYRLSRAILMAGVVVFVAVLAFAYLGILTGNYPTSGTGPVVLATDVIGSAGFAMIFVGAVFASHNWSLLRESRRDARPGPPG
jgi:hypothetical protein